MHWWWWVPAAAGVWAMGAAYKFRSPRMGGREGGPAFETFRDVRECLRAGVKPIQRQGWRHWHVEVEHGSGGRGPEPRQADMARVETGDRVWLIADKQQPKAKTVTVMSNEGPIGLLRVSENCRTAIDAGRVAAFVRAVAKPGTFKPKFELLVLQSPVPLESARRLPESMVPAIQSEGLQVQSKLQPGQTGSTGGLIGGL